MRSVVSNANASDNANDIDIDIDIGNTGTSPLALEHAIVAWYSAVQALNEHQTEHGFLTGRHNKTKQKNQIELG